MSILCAIIIVKNRRNAICCEVRDGLKNIVLLQLIQQRSMSDNPKTTPIRQRMTPTFYHHNIFFYQQQNTSQVRTNPTFQSTVFNIDGYQIQTNHTRTLKKQQQTKDPKPCVYINQSRERKQAFLYPYSNFGGVEMSRTSCINDQKEKLAEDINHIGGRTSRLRKCVQQMSNPIFGGYSWTPFIAQNTQQKQQTTYNPNNYRYQRQAHKQEQANQKIVTSDYQDAKTKAKQIYQKENPKPTKKQQSKSITKNIKPNDKHKNTLKRFKSASTLSQKPPK